jgi:hypothetical protein
MILVSVALTKQIAPGYSADPDSTTDRPPVRRELRDMRDNHQKEWTLFLLGLEKFQDTDESHPLSWFQIAGTLLENSHLL